MVASEADLDDGGINVVQQKTSKKLWIPLHADLAAEMRGWKIGASGLFVETRGDAEGRAIHL